MLGTEPSKRYIHGLDYTPVEEAERERAIKQLMRDYPNTPGGEFWAELVYDFVTNASQEEIKAVMQRGSEQSKFCTVANKMTVEEYNASRELEESLHWHIVKFEHRWQCNTSVARECYTCFFRANDQAYTELFFYVQKLLFRQPIE